MCIKNNGKDYPDFSSYFGIQKAMSVFFANQTKLWRYSAEMLYFSNISTHNKPFWYETLA